MSSDIVLMIEGLRNKMLADHRIICVTDFGSGSEYMKGNLRKVSDIAKYSSVPKKYGVLLASLAAEFGGNGIIELGTSLGISTMYMATGCKGSTVCTVEGCSSTYKVAKEYIQNSGLHNIETCNGTFDETIILFHEKSLTPGLIFIDGDHKKESLIRYFTGLIELSGKNTVIVIDDIHSSASMGEAWEWIKQNERVTMTVDIFRMGLVFFKQGVTRSDYVIRY